MAPFLDVTLTSAANPACTVSAPAPGARSLAWGAVTEISTELFPITRSSEMSRQSKLPHPCFAVDWTTINFSDEIPSNSEAQIGRSRFFGELERNAEIHNFLRLRSKRIFSGKPDPANACPIGFVLGILPIDPASLPVGRMQQAHFPPGLLGRGRHLAGRIPDTNCPVVSLARLQRGSLVSNSNRLVGLRFSAVPNIGRARTQ